jgi:hypothetical protein
LHWANISQDFGLKKEEWLTKMFKAVAYAVTLACTQIKLFPAFVKNSGLLRISVAA